MQDELITTKPLPAFLLYSVTGEGKNARWTKIGAAWPNRDGKGFSINCGAMPLHGRMVMRTFEPRAEYEPR